MHRAITGDDVRLIVKAGIDHRILRDHLAQGGDEQRQHGELGPLAPACVQLRAQRLQIGYVAFLDIGKVRDVALGGSHVLGDALSEADDLDGLVSTRLARRAETAVVGEEGVEVGMANAPVGGGLHLGEINPEIARTLAHGGGSEDFCLSPSLRGGGRGVGVRGCGS